MSSVYVLPSSEFIVSGLGDSPEDTVADLEQTVVGTLIDHGQLQYLLRNDVEESRQIL